MNTMVPRVDSRRSTRVDPRTGTVEHAGFLGADGQKVFAVSYTPPSRPSGLVLISSSLLADRIRTYRAEVDMARRLAGAGFAVGRYDYRGFGHSDGGSGEATRDTMIEDLQLVHTEMVSSVGDLPLVHIGVRFGALLAAAGVERVGGDVALWEPALSASAYFREAFRAHMIGRLSHEQKPATPESQLASVGTAEVLGFSVTAELRATTTEMELSDPIARSSARVLWVPFGESPGKKQTTLVEGWRSAGLQVDVRTVSIEDSTWFIGARPIVGDDVVERTADWVAGLART